MQCCDFDRSLMGFAGHCKPENSFGFQACAEQIKMWDPLVARSSVMVEHSTARSCVFRVAQGVCQDVCKCWSVSSYVLSV